MKYALAFFVSLIAVTFGFVAPAHADTSIELRPLLVQTALGAGEAQQGVIDVTNPTGNDLVVKLDVQGFKQVDDKGTLSFFESEQLRAGITTDFNEVLVPARKTLRLVYKVDGTKLPQGDVFAAVFAKATETAGDTVPGVKVGTLLVITNGTPQTRQATITNMAIPWQQFSGSLQGSIAIKNTAPPESASGFFPDIALSLWPFGPSETVKGPLIFAGNTRTIDIDTFKNRVGIYRLTVGTGSDTKEQIVVLIPPSIQWVILALILVISGGIYWLTQKKRRKLAKHRPRPLRKHR